VIDDPATNAINQASAAALNRIYDFAARFSAKEDYLPLEKLAEDVQEVIIRTFAARNQDPKED
jgi:hypothetical protein